MPLLQYFKPSLTRNQAEEPRFERSQASREDPGLQEHGAGSEPSELSDTSVAILPHKKRRRTYDEILLEIPSNHPRWNDGTQCEEGCTCWFCEIYFGFIDDVEGPKNEMDADPDGSNGFTLHEPVN